MMDEEIVLKASSLLYDYGRIAFRAKRMASWSREAGANCLSTALSSCGQLDPSFVESLVGVVSGVVQPGEGEDLLMAICSYADAIAFGAPDEKAVPSESPLARDEKLRVIFNRVNGASGSAVVEHADYESILEKIDEALRKLTASQDVIEFLSGVAERETSEIPASTDAESLIDASLYEVARLRQALSVCLYRTAQERGVATPEALASAIQEPPFLLFSFDLSGIQDFIYGISGDGALRQLRARSFYLEVLLEHVVDELLTRLRLGRENLLYSGGGHAHVLLPNTEEVKSQLEQLRVELGEWLIDEYGIALGVVSAYVECGVADLAGAHGQGAGSLFQKLSERVSAQKAHRYSARDILRLEELAASQTEQLVECSECQCSYKGIVGKGFDAGKCPTCSSLGRISRDLVDGRYFVVCKVEEETSSRATMPLPFGCSLSVWDEVPFDAEEKGYRVYAKQGSLRDGGHHARCLWMCDYTYNARGEGIADYASVSSVLSGRGNSSPGIERLGVLRADVDNLGVVFSSGFGEGRQCLARTNSLSRALSYFFKVKLNDVLEAAQYRLQVIYSGGDDLFIIGNWNDVIHAAIDIRKSFRSYVGGDAITLSAGIGIFKKKYPVVRMAEGAGLLEDAAKLYVHPDDPRLTKDAVALWSDENVFSWDELYDKIRPLLAELEDVFENNQAGKSLIYKIVAQLRNYSDLISAPRLAYLLSRSFEGRQDGDKQAKWMYEMAGSEQGRKRLSFALEWYVYSIRERG